MSDFWELFLPVSAIIAGVAFLSYRLGKNVGDTKRSQEKLEMEKTILKDFTANAGRLFRKIHESEEKNPKDLAEKYTELLKCLEEEIRNCSSDALLTSKLSNDAFTEIWYNIGKTDGISEEGIIMDEKLRKRTRDLLIALINVLEHYWKLISAVYDDIQEKDVTELKEAMAEAKEQIKLDDTENRLGELTIKIMETIEKVVSPIDRTEKHNPID